MVTRLPTPRNRHLDALDHEGEQAWQRVNALIDTKKTREYDTAVELLRDLRDILVGPRRSAPQVHERERTVGPNL